MATIEELKEAKEALTTEEGYAAGCRCKYCKAVDAVLPLIDAELERQSVTEEDVKDAICAVKQIMNRLVEIDEDFMRMAGADRETWCLIIDALEHYQTIRTCKCGYEMNSELINEYQAKHCINCGRDG